MLSSCSQCHHCSLKDNSTYTWPDDATRSQCLPINISSTFIRHLNGSLLFTFISLIFIGTCVTGVLYFVNRQNRLIKASSRELSFVMIIGHVITCIMAAHITLMPSTYSCCVVQAGIFLSFNVTYAPLFLKTLRIYRIFAHNVPSPRKLRCIGFTHQVILACFIITIQVSTKCFK